MSHLPAVRKSTWSCLRLFTSQMERRHFSNERKLERKADHAQVGRNCLLLRQHIPCKLRALHMG